MKKVELTIHGKRILVDEDQVKKHLTKGRLISQVRELENELVGETDPVYIQIVKNELAAISRRIIWLNSSIRQNVQFI